MLQSLQAATDVRAGHVLSGRRTEHTCAASFLKKASTTRPTPCSDCWTLFRSFYFISILRGRFKIKQSSGSRHRAAECCCARCTHLATATLTSSPQLAASARRRRVSSRCSLRSHRRWSPTAAPAARQPTASQHAKQSTCHGADALPLEPHRRVDKVADAGRYHPRYQRLQHEQKKAGGNGQPLSGCTNLIRSEIDEAIAICNIGHVLEIGK